MMSNKPVDHNDIVNLGIDEVGNDLIAATLPVAGDDTSASTQSVHNFLTYRDHDNLSVVSGLRGFSNKHKDPNAINVLSTETKQRNMQTSPVVVSDPSRLARQLHNVVNGTDFHNSSAVHLPYSESNNSTGSANSKDHANSLLLYILMFIILAPCLAATVAQAMYLWKKRQRDRIERELTAVSTNPAGRRIILDEIFKGNSRAVTGEEVSPKKKRVLVKKRRKKTPAERNSKSDKQRGVKDIEDSDAKSESFVATMRGSDGGDTPTNGNGCEPWWQEEQVRTKSKDDLDLDIERRGRIVICISEDLVVGDGDLGRGVSLSAMDDLPGVKKVLFPREDQFVEKGDDIDNGSAPKRPEVTSESTSHEEEALSTNKLPPLSIDVSFDNEDKVYMDEGDTDQAHTVNNDIDNDVLGVKVDNLAEEVEERKMKAGFCIKTSVGDGESLAIGVSGDTEKVGQVSPPSHSDDQEEISASPKVLSMPNLNQTVDESLAIRLEPKIHCHPDNHEVIVSGPAEHEGQNDFFPPQVPMLSEDKVVESVSDCDNTGSLNILKTKDSKIEVPESLSTERELVQSSYGLILPTLCEQHGDYEAEPDDRADLSKNHAIIFRDGKTDDEIQYMNGIHALASSVTEVASNVESPRSDAVKESQTEAASLPDTSGSSGAGASDVLPSYRLERQFSEMSSASGGLSLSKPISLMPAESYVTDASSVSYFSYEDVSIDEEESEMCAICLCAYEEGDIRIFSKRCTHAFHKECVFEWLVSGHEECPCCRADMVTKSEIKETSASLIGTERLAQAMAVVNGSGMIEAPPFQARRSRLASQFLARARSRRPTAVRFQNRRASAPTQMERLNEGAPLSPRSPTSSTNNIHNRDWLWTARFEGASNQSATPPTSPTTQTGTDVPTNNVIPAHERTRAAVNNEFVSNAQDSSMYHSHWAQRSRNTSSTNSPRRSSQQSQPIALSPSVSNRHAHWQRTSAQLEHPTMVRQGAVPVCTNNTQSTDVSPVQVSSRDGLDATESGS